MARLGMCLRAYLKKQEDEKKSAAKKHADEDKKNHAEQQLKNVQADMKALKATFDKGKKSIEEHEKMVKFEKDALAKVDFAVKTVKEVIREREHLASYMSAKVKRMMLNKEIKRMIGR
ncbi:hypothetical protein BDZ45DRAFT_741589 [Acephala macrosclerotiorum]|nr:hypothetical protein BDZ45DRAFT_741589 [Acephala macrosclerotiorum]